MGISPCSRDQSTHGPASNEASNSANCVSHDAIRVAGGVEKAMNIAWVLAHLGSNASVAVVASSTRAQQGSNVTFALSSTEPGVAVQGWVRAGGAGRLAVDMAAELPGELVLLCLAAGQVWVDFNATVGEGGAAVAVAPAGIEVRVVRFGWVVLLEEVLGWCYFVAWGLSFLPQVVLNWRRKSVVGLSFDFLAYNLTGHVGYLIFNSAMFFEPGIQAAYRERHPTSTNPVRANDVAFTVWSTVLTLATIAQCFVYESGKQRVSLVCRCLLGGVWTFVAVSLALALAGELSWLHWVEFFSYVKIGITLVKYVPQALFNARRRSTDGWSIGNILLDLTGGALSLMQQSLQAWNNDDITVFVGDPTKLGLAVFSILFDILFILQHYVLYPRSAASPVNGLRADEKRPLLAGAEA